MMCAHLFNHFLREGESDLNKSNIFYLLQNIDFKLKFIFNLTQNHIIFDCKMFYHKMPPQIHCYQKMRHFILGPFVSVGYFDLTVWTCLQMAALLL